MKVARQTSRIKRYSLLTLLIGFLSYMLLLGIDNLYPPDISKAQILSLITTDQQGQWLRVYLSDDDKYRIRTTHTELPDDYLKLLINYEDQDFYTHHGVDASAIIRASWQNLSNGHIVSGASTLTMQTARLLMPQPKSFMGKITQAFRAWQLERRFSKSEILNMYLTLAPVGGNREGLTVASYYYLNKPADKLSLAESAWLIALTQSPENLSKNNDLAIKARNKVLKRAVDNAIITTERYQQAIAEPLVIQATPFPKWAMHASEYAKKQHKGKETKITTHLNYALQTGLEKLLQAQIPLQHPKANLAGGILDNKTGQWLAYVGSADFFNPERYGQIDMLTAIRSPGSALKPFITLFAFDWLHYAPETTIDDTPMVSVYQPSNYDGLFQGRISLATALRNSRNVPAVRLLKVIQPAYFSSTLQKNNLRLFLPKGAKPNLTIALGGVGVQGDELTKLYSKLANCTFRSEKGLANSSACKNITAILNTSQNANGPVFFGKEPVAFKTGTSYGWRDRWLFAYTKDYTITLWNGRADHEFSENKASADVLIPLLRQVVGLLPNPPKIAPQLSVNNRRNQDLPQQLRHVDTQENKQPSTHPDEVVLDTTQKDLNPFYIATPLNNSTIEYQKNINLVVKIHGGTPPYMYLINDQIMDQTHSTSLMIKHPSTGRYEVLVIDANGLSTTTQFTIKTPQTENKTPTPIEWKKQKLVR